MRQNDWFPHAPVFSRRLFEKGSESLPLSKLPVLSKNNKKFPGHFDFYGGAKW